MTSDDQDREPVQIGTAVHELIEGMAQAAGLNLMEWQKNALEAFLKESPDTQFRRTNLSDPPFQQSRELTSWVPMDQGTRERLGDVTERLQAAPVLDQDATPIPVPGYVPHFDRVHILEPYPCPAHGERRCPECTRPGGAVELDGTPKGSCDQCSTFGDLLHGYHWDTCPNRDRSPLGGAQ